MTNSNSDRCIGETCSFDSQCFSNNCSDTEDQGFCEDIDTSIVSMLIFLGVSLCFCAICIVGIVYCVRRQRQRQALIDSENGVHSHKSAKGRNEPVVVVVSRPGGFPGQGQMIGQ